LTLLFERTHFLMFRLDLILFGDNTVVIHQEKTFSARTPDHSKNRKVNEFMPIRRSISFATILFQLVVLHIRGKELSDDRHSCAGNVERECAHF